MFYLHDSHKSIFSIYLIYCPKLTKSVDCSRIHYVLCVTSFPHEYLPFPALLYAAYYIIINPLPLPFLLSRHILLDFLLFARTRSITWGFMILLICLSNCVKRMQSTDPSLPCAQSTPTHLFFNWARYESAYLLHFTPRFSICDMLYFLNFHFFLSLSYFFHYRSEYSLSKFSPWWKR